MDEINKALMSEAQLIEKIKKQKGNSFCWMYSIIFLEFFMLVFLLYIGLI
jgi:hypothetical protein